MSRMLGRGRPWQVCCDDCDDSPSWKKFRKRQNKRLDEREWKREVRNEEKSENES